MKFNKTERIGVYSIAKIFANDFEWVFREQPINDFGIDAIVETTEKVNPIKKYINPTGKLIGIQIKSGKSYFKESNSIGIVFRGEKKHLKYWSNYSIPVIIVIHDEEKEISYWQVVNNSTTILTNQHWKIIIPFENVLSIQKIKQLKDIAKYRTQYEYKLSLFKNSEFLIEELLRNKKYFLYIGIGENYLKKDEYFISLLFSN